MKKERITQRLLDSLPEYSLSNPTGVVLGKVWKRNSGMTDPPTWIICEYVASRDPAFADIECRQPEIVSS